MIKILISASLFALLVTPATSVANAAEVNLVATVAVRGAITDLASQFERSSGNHVTVIFAPGPAAKKKIDQGDTFDIAILTLNLIDELTKTRKVDATTVTTIARTGIGVAVRSGTPKPDLSSVEALKRSLKAAKSIGLTDPASGVAGAVYVAKMFERLGIAGELKPKVRLYPAGSGGFPNAIRSGEVELWLTQTSEIVPVVGIDFAGPLPPEVQFYTVFAAASSTKARGGTAVQDLLTFFASPSANAVFRSAGLEPSS